MHIFSAEGHLLTPFRIVYKYRKAAAAVLSGSLIAGAVLSLLTTPSFRASAVVRLEPADESVMHLELARLKSRDTARQVVAKLNLAGNADFVRPETPEALHRAFAHFEKRMISLARAVAGRRDQASAPAVAEKVGDTESASDIAAVDVLEKHLEVEALPATRLLTISFSSTSSTLAALIPNEIAATSASLIVVEPAQPAPHPYQPDIFRILFYSSMVGLTLGVLLTFVLNWIDDTIKTPQDVLGKLDIPFLGLVPTIQTDRQPILSRPVPRHFSEAYRTLRSSIVFTNPTETTRVVLCASARPGEGRTTTACNMAMVLAYGGARVLLIDADLRSPGVHEKLLVTNAVGLAHLLVGQARIRDTMQRTNNPNLCVITAGGTPENAPELLASERMKQLIAHAKHGPFDWIVIDSPPVLSSGDAVILTGIADGVAFVLGADMTRRRLAAKAIQMITANQLKIVGAVLNRVKVHAPKQTSRRAIARQYRAYYGIDGTAASKNLVKS